MATLDANPSLVYVPSIDDGNDDEGAIINSRR